MSTSTILCDNPARTTTFSRFADFVELTKPRIAVLELACVAAAALFAGPPTVGALAATLVGVGLVAASASALNQWLERRSDSLMPRTADRPLPGGRIAPRQVVVFGGVSLAIGLATLILAVNVATAVVSLATWALYVCVYTPLKRRSVANTAVGAVAGALPVLMGWTCQDKPLDLEAAALFVVVFLWQLPHFMAIAWIYRKEYAAADLKMLPVVDASGRRAGAQAVIAALAIIPVSLVPAWHLIEPVYFAGALVLGLGQLFYSVGFLVQRDDGSARRLLRASLLYLPVLLALLLSVPFV